MADNSHGFQIIDNVSDIFLIYIRKIDKHLIQRHLSCHFQYIFLICIDPDAVDDYALAVCIHTCQGDDFIIDVQCLLQFHHSFIQDAVPGNHHHFYQIGLGGKISPEHLFHQQSDCPH